MKYDNEELEKNTPSYVGEELEKGLLTHEFDFEEYKKQLEETKLRVSLMNTDFTKFKNTFNNEKAKA